MQSYNKKTALQQKQTYPKNTHTDTPDRKKTRLGESSVKGHTWKSNTVRGDGEIRCDSHVSHCNPIRHRLPGTTIVH